MEKKWVKMQLLGLFLVIFVLRSYLMLYPYALMTQPPSNVIPFCKFMLFYPLKGIALPLGSISTDGFEIFTSGSQVLMRGLFLLRILFSLLILASGIGLILKRKKALTFTLYTALAFVILNGLSLALYSPIILNAIRAYGRKAIPHSLNKIIATLIFGIIAYYLTRPKIKEQFE